MYSGLVQDALMVGNLSSFLPNSYVYTSHVLLLGVVVRLLIPVTQLKPNIQLCFVCLNTEQYFWSSMTESQHFHQNLNNITTKTSRYNLMKCLLDTLTGKKLGGIGPPAIPSCGGIWPSGLGAAAFWKIHKYNGLLS